jgi:hypothetical protein
LLMLINSQNKKMASLNSEISSFFSPERAFVNSKNGYILYIISQAVH